jgi:methionyl-tRNA formyltransferase
MSPRNPQFAFFGTPNRAVIVLDILKQKGLVPSLIITQPDRPQGRKLKITPPPVKVWAEKEKVNVVQPHSLDDDVFIELLKKGSFDVFIVVAYGKIIPETVLRIPKHGALNLHASLLPKYRGSCPIETAILHDDKHTGVTIIQMDEKMDHGPIVAAKEVVYEPWPPTADELAHRLVTDGAELIAHILPDYVDGKITPTEQDHANATYTKKITKADGEISLTDDAYTNYLKYKAYYGWPGIYYFDEKNGVKTRIKITEADYSNGRFIIKKIVPEGGKEITVSGN